MRYFSGFFDGGSGEKFMNIGVFEPIDDAIVLHNIVTQTPLLRYFSPNGIEKTVLIAIDGFSPH